MARIFRLQREERYTDGQKYWNTLKSSRNAQKLQDEAQKMSGHVRVIEEEDD